MKERYMFALLFLNTLEHSVSCMLICIMNADVVGIALGVSDIRQLSISVHIFFPFDFYTRHDI